MAFSHWNRGGFILYVYESVMWLSTSRTSWKWMPLVLVPRFAWVYHLFHCNIARYNSLYCFLSQRVFKEFIPSWLSETHTLHQPRKFPRALLLTLSTALTRNFNRSAHHSHTLEETRPPLQLLQQISSRHQKAVYHLHRTKILTSGHHTALPTTYPPTSSLHQFPISIISPYTLPHPIKSRTPDLRAPLWFTTRTT